MKIKLNCKAVTWLVGLGTFLLLLKISYDVAVITATLLILGFTLVFDRNKLWAWIPALSVGIIFVLVIRDMYSSYNVFTLKIRGLMLFPMLAWALMLMFWYLVVEPYFHHDKWWRKWLTNAALFCAGLIVFEIIGYHVLGVRLGAGSTYPGWPVLDIFHAPWWMQVAYFFNGIAFIGVVAFVDNILRRRTGKS
ncbi:MAG TPA: hypothetical protein PLJ76_07900 [Treponemataceae bacterium]|nr:hypothetical protein [Treponemataceae bacterium]